MANSTASVQRTPSVIDRLVEALKSPQFSGGALAMLLYMSPRVTDEFSLGVGVVAAGIFGARLAKGVMEARRGVERPSGGTAGQDG